MAWSAILIGVVLGVANGIRILVRKEIQMTTAADLHAKGVLTDSQYAVAVEKAEEMGKRCWS